MRKSKDKYTIELKIKDRENKKDFIVKGHITNDDLYELNKKYGMDYKFLLNKTINNAFDEIMHKIDDEIIHKIEKDGIKPNFINE